MINAETIAPQKVKRHMKKLMRGLIAMSVLLVAMTATMVKAETLLREGVINIASNGTFASSQERLVGKYSDGYRTIKRFTIRQSEGNSTGTVVFATMDVGMTNIVMATGANIASSTGTRFSCMPACTNLVAGSGQTNVVDYTARDVWIGITQTAATNATVYRYGIYAE